jgi:hypothetical protein
LRHVGAEITSQELKFSLASVLEMTRRGREKSVGICARTWRKSAVVRCQFQGWLEVEESKE